MKWGAKVLAFWAFQLLPYGQSIYYFSQRHITKHLRPGRPISDYRIEHFLSHLEFFQATRGDLADLTYFEFGAGWELTSALIMWCGGINRQFIYDLNEYARPELVNDCILALQKFDHPTFKRHPQMLVASDNFKAELLTHYGIDYRAPGDARATGLPAQSIDLISSTSTLEHVPPLAIAEILAECRRIAKPNASIRFIVSYSDHYAHSDSSITEYNYLKFPGWLWNLFNPSIHYQNRLRHRQHAELIRNAGFQIIEERETEPENSRRDLETVKRAHPFNEMPDSEVIATTGYFLLAVPH